MNEPDSVLFPCEEDKATPLELLFTELEDGVLPMLEELGFFADEDIPSPELLLGIMEGFPEEDEFS
jgi:hypothetical protein